MSCFKCVSIFDVCSADWFRSMQVHWFINQRNPDNICDESSVEHNAQSVFDCQLCVYCVLRKISVFNYGHQHLLAML